MVSRNVGQISSKCYIILRFVRETIKILSKTTEICRNSKGAVLASTSYPMNIKKKKQCNREIKFKVRCVSVIRKAQISPRVWNFFRFTRENQGNTKKNQKTSKKYRV